VANSIKNNVGLFNNGHAGEVKLGLINTKVCKSYFLS